MTVQPDASVRVETPVLSMRRHGRVLFWPVLVLIAVAAAAGYYVGALPEPWMNLAAGLGALGIALLFGFGPIISWLVNRITISDRRVVVRRGLLVHRRSEVPLSRVREVRMKRGPIQRLFGSGNIELVVGAESPVMLRDLPGPTATTEALQELIEQHYQLSSASARAGDQGID